jgi:hypothetical protein
VGAGLPAGELVVRDAQKAGLDRDAARPRDGVRITSGAAALPIALILIDGAENRVAIRRILVTGLISAAIVVRGVRSRFTPGTEPGSSIFTPSTPFPGRWKSRRG